MQTIHPKIQELRKKSQLINYKQVDELLVDETNDRVLKGYLAVFNNKDFSGEKFIKGTFAKSIKDRGPDSLAKNKILFLSYHKTNKPLSAFTILKEDNYGLYFESKPLDNVPWADEVLIQVKSGTLNQLSVGFMPVWDKAYYDETDDSIVFAESFLFEGSVVTFGDNPETYFVKSIDEVSELFDDTENFVNLLPQTMQIEARKLFQIYKSLSFKEPIESLRAKVKPNKDEKKKELDYTKFLLENL